MIIRSITQIILMCAATSVVGQVGIGTEDPMRQLELYGSGDKYARLHGLSIDAMPMLELVRGTAGDDLTDWRLANEGGLFKVYSGDFKTYSAQDLRLQVTPDGYVGVGLYTPYAPLNTTFGEFTSSSDNGQMLLGATDDYNLVLSPYVIQARNNGAASGLFLQSEGGNSYFNNNGGDIRLGFDGSRIGIGTSSPSHRASIHGETWQMKISNDGSAGGINAWFIGASGDAWSVDDNQLLFSASLTSSSSVLRIRDVADNDGNVAPLEIHSGSQALLIDGDEIDSKNGALYVNHNSQENTYINPTGGKVCIGTDVPGATVKVISPSDTYALSIAKGGSRWDLRPWADPPGIVNGFLYWYENGDIMASISGTSGQWNSSSDERKKHNIQPVSDVLDLIMDVNVFSYSFKTDPLSRRYLGVMAQELEQILPEAVVKAEDRMGVAYGELAAWALQAIKEQQGLIDQLEAQISALENQYAHSDQK